MALPSAMTWTRGLPLRAFASSVSTYCCASGSDSQCRKSSSSFACDDGTNLSSMAAIPSRLLPSHLSSTAAAKLFEKKRNLQVSPVTRRQRTYILRICSDRYFENSLPQPSRPGFPQVREIKTDCTVPRFNQLL
jgi:hypothetical protein